MLMLTHKNKYKNIIIVQLNFLKKTEEDIKQNVMFRYNTLFGRAVITKNAISDMFSILEDKNSALLKYVTKNTSMTHSKPIYWII